MPLFLLVCVCMCENQSSFSLIRRAIQIRLPQTRNLWKRARVGQRVGRALSHAVPKWSRSPGCCWFRGVFRVGRIFPCSFCSDFFLFERTWPAASMRQPLASSHFVLVMRLGRESEATEAVFRLSAKKSIHTGVRTGFHYLVVLLVCVCLCL